MKSSTLEYLMTGLRSQTSALEEHLKQEGETAAAKMVGVAWKALKEASEILHEEAQERKIREEDEREEKLQNGQFGAGA